MSQWIILCLTLASFGTQANAADKCKFDRPQGVPVIEKDCASMCQADLDCTHYHYEFMPMQGFVRCYLYKGPQQTMVKSKELRCGLRDIWINMGNSSFGQNCLFTGKIVKLDNLTSSKQCLDNCKEDPQCTHFNFFGDLHMDSSNVTECRLMSGNHGGKNGALLVNNGHQVQCGFLLSKAKYEVYNDETINENQEVNQTLASFQPTWISVACYLAGIFTTPLIYIMYRPMSDKLKGLRKERKATSQLAHNIDRQQRKSEDTMVTKVPVKFEDEEIELSDVIVPSPQNELEDVRVHSDKETNKAGVVMTYQDDQDDQESIDDTSSNSYAQETWSD